MGLGLGLGPNLGVVGPKHQYDHVPLGRGQCTEAGAQPVGRVRADLHRRPTFAEVGHLVALAQQRGEDRRVGVCAATRTVPGSDRVTHTGDEGLVVRGGGSLGTRVSVAVDAKRAVGEATVSGVREVCRGERRIGDARRDGQRRAPQPRPRAVPVPRCSRTPPTVPPIGHRRGAGGASCGQCWQKQKRDVP